MDYTIIYQLVKYRKMVVKFVITRITSKLRGLNNYISIDYIVNIYRKNRNCGYIER